MVQKWPTKLTPQTVEEALQTFRHTILKVEVPIEVKFELESWEILGQDNEYNFQGSGQWRIDSEYGGGPVSVSTTFNVVDGELEIDVETVDYDHVFDWEDIEFETTSGSFFYNDDDTNEQYPNDDDEDYSQEVSEQVNEEVNDQLEVQRAEEEGDF
ncbi:hypothetical protein [Mycoplasma sp. ATU-Cv-703]|uniref:hypothetical protein n=1 Tax=Mycoplasma sp. ATU-Cv-703 TaxID=2498595 RepID=UPI000FDF0C3D